MPCRCAVGSTSSSMPRTSSEYGRLLGAEALQAALARGPLRLDDLPGRVRGGADVADLALLHEVGERAERLLDVDAGSGRWTW